MCLSTWTTLVWIQITDLCVFWLVVQVWRGDSTSLPHATSAKIEKTNFCAVAFHVIGLFPLYSYTFFVTVLLWGFLLDYSSWTFFVCLFSVIYENNGDKILFFLANFGVLAFWICVLNCITPMHGFTDIFNLTLSIGILKVK